jgi:glucan phosphoethanolaminetransferase (alkaline phosphatase superfamily)
MISIFENYESILININSLAFEIWQLIIFQTSFQESSLIVIIWSIVSYFVGLFITFYILKIIIEGVFKFIFNPLTILFIIFILGLSIWTLTQLNKEYQNKTLKIEHSNSLLPGKVKIEEINPVQNDNKNDQLNEDTEISETMKEIDRLQILIEKQEESLRKLKNN